jgi:hypothetical protein
MLALRLTNHTGDTKLNEDDSIYETLIVERALPKPVKARTI